MSLRLSPAATAIQTSVDGGLFKLASREPGWWLVFILSNGLGWEHVSVRAVRSGTKHTVADRTPTWREMCQVKAACWPAEDFVLQFHPPSRDYVNIHPHVLHLWRPTDGLGISLPPRECV